MEPSDAELDFLDSPATPAKTKTRAARQYRTPLPVDLDLVSGDLPLRPFLQERKPDSDVKIYLAIAYWLKRYRDINEVSADHAYTCYRHMGAGWQVPADAGQPFRAMKAKAYGWVKPGSTKGYWMINHLGENEVEQMGNGNG